MIAGLVGDKAQNGGPSSENGDEDTEGNEYGSGEFESDGPFYLHREVDAKRLLEKSRRTRLEDTTKVRKYRRRRRF